VVRLGEGLVAEIVRDNESQLGHELGFKMFELLRSFAASATDYVEAGKHARRIRDVAPLLGGEAGEHAAAWQEFHLAESRIGLRCYDEAAISLAKAFAEACARSGRRALPAATVEELDEGGLREAAQAFGGLKPVADETLHLAIACARRFLFLRMLEARVLGHTSGGEQTGEFRVLQEKAQRWYIFGAALGRFQRNQEDFRRDEVMLRVHSSVNLANLQRFSEARRRLNEASAILMRWRGLGPSSYWSILALRRAEVFKREAEWACRAGEHGRCKQALDEAQAALGRARTDSLNGHAGLWWRTLACEMELEVLALRLSVPTSAEEQTRMTARAPALYLEGERLIRVDVYRLARLADVSLGILQRDEGLKAQARRFAAGARNRLRDVDQRRLSLVEYPLDRRVSTYVEMVDNRLERSATGDSVT
jgi:hypothetical protein